MTETHDVFLCHSGQDKPLVLKLASALEAGGLQVFLDVWDLTPGRPWPEELAQAIKSTNSAAVLFGPSGIGPWAEQEMWAFLGEFARRKLPVIPVLLPGVSPEFELPVFLREFTWVDLRDGLNPEGIQRLVRGIKGQRRTRARAVDSTSSGSAQLWNVPLLPNEHRPRGELAALKRALLSGQTQSHALSSRHVRFSVQGMGGVGKTVLATALARDADIQRAFPDGVFWLTLGQTPEDPLLAQGRLAEAAGSSRATPWAACTCSTCSSETRLLR